MSHHVWVLWVPLFYGGWLLPIGLGRDPDPYHREHEPDHCASHNLMYSWRMVKAGNGLGRPEFCRPMWVYHPLPTPETKPKSNGSCMCLPLPILTGSCARGAKPLVVLVWSRILYHCLPFFGSGFDPWPYDLYQSLPPRRRTGD